MYINETNLIKHGNLSYGNNPDSIVFHHAEASRCTIEDINQWHLENGWVMCGYHFFVRKDGSIYRGRPENAIGSHCPSMNSHSIGICAEGEYMTETMPEVQRQSLIELGQYLKNKYRIKNVYGHKECFETSCPGTNYPLQDIKNGIMNGVLNIQPQSSSSSTLSVSTIKTVQHNLNLLGIRDNHGNKLIEDGIIGTNSIGAITNFQSVVGLSTDGVYGSQTESALSQILSKPLCNLNNTYKYATKYIQWYLGISNDGIYGQGTLGAVKSWQNKVKCKYIDGIWGNECWSKIF